MSLSRHLVDLVFPHYGKVLRRSLLRLGVPRSWVVNTSPVITLAKAGCLALLTDLAATMPIPDAVAMEMLAGPQSDAARRVLE